MRLLAYLILIGFLYAVGVTRLFAAQPDMTPGARLLLGQMTKEEFVLLSKFEPDQPHLALHKARPILVPKPIAAKRLALNTPPLKQDKPLSNNKKTTALSPILAKKATLPAKHRTKVQHQSAHKKTTTNKVAIKSAKTHSKHAMKKHSHHR